MRLFDAVRHEQAALRIEREAVRLVEFAVESRAELAELLDELAGAVEANQARVRVAVAFRDEDVAVRIGDHVIRLIERRGIRRLAGHVAAGLAERQQHLAIGAELDHLVADHLGRHRRQRRISGLAGPAGRQVALTVGHPDVAVAIDVDAVREDEHALAEARDHLAALVELEDGLERRHFILGAIPAGIRRAPLGDPDAAAVLVDVDRARRSPGAALGQLRPAFNRVVRIRRVVGRRRRRPRPARRCLRRRRLSTARSDQRRSSTFQMPPRRQRPNPLE